MKDAFCRDKVLLVEDHDVVAGLITKLLLQQGWQVIRARDGAKSLAEFAEHREGISFVMLDWKLPDTDGISLCHQLREQCPGLPVILTSGKNQSEMIAVLEQGGPTAFLPKPFYPQDVLRQVAALIGPLAQS